MTKRPGSGVPSARPAARGADAAPGGVRQGALRGVVKGPDGTPAEGVTVRAFLLSDHGGGLIANNGAAYALRQAPPSATTGPDGRFTLELPAGGKVNLEAAWRDDLKAFVPEPSAAEELEMRLKKTGRVVGRVAAAAASGVTDLTGADVFIPGSSYVGKADRDGNFVLAGVPEGTFTVIVSKGGLGRATATGVAVAPEQTTTLPALTLERQPPTITKLVPPVIAPGKPLTIEGTNFGAATGDALRVIVDGFVAPLAERAGDGRIRITVPERAVAGEVVVSVDGLRSAPATARLLTKLEAVPWVTGPLRVGETTFVSWRALDGEGREVTDLPPTWTSSDGAAEVRDGRVIGVRAGNATVTATIGAVAAEVPLAVTEGRVARTFVGYPEPAFVPGGEAGLAATYAELAHAIYTPQQPAPGAAFAKPYGLALHGAKLYVGQRDFAGIAEVDLATGAIGRVKGTEAAATSKIATAMLAVSPAGILFLTTWPTHNAIFKIEGDAPVSVAGDDAQRAVVDGPKGTAQVRMPLYLAVDDAGTVYFCDEDKYVVRACRPDGTITTVAGALDAEGYADGPGEDARFGALRGMAFDPQGRLVVLDHGNKLIRRIDVKDPAHPVTRWTGKLKAGVHQDGTPDVTSFRSLACLAFDRAGAAFVTDTTFNHLRRIAPDGSSTTFAGTGEGQSRDGVVGAAAGGAALRLPLGVVVDGERGVVVVSEYESSLLRLVRY